MIYGFVLIHTVCILIGLLNHSSFISIAISYMFLLETLIYTYLYIRIRLLVSIENSKEKRQEILFYLLLSIFYFLTYGLIKIFI